MVFVVMAVLLHLSVRPTQHLDAHELFPKGLPLGPTIEHQLYLWLLPKVPGECVDDIK